MKKYFRLKKQYALYASVALFAAVFYGCPEEDTLEEDAQKAAAEYCECLESKSHNECLEELNDNYGKYAYENSKFMEAFNKAQTCGEEIVFEED
ncbi:MAG: hypothetical protein LBC40_10015 [Dysgonamonadaceae bacterium]|jgi:hypothetical protein|nr:hypothetical protein [Dysgonamonadaceae bacterium]